jgi:hypothetical protein
MKKHIWFFLFVLSIFIFLSCDGRKTKSESLKESITQFKDSIGLLEITKFTPEEYTEVKTDTILDNNFSISIRTYTDMEKSIITKYKIDTITFIEHHRNWISEVKVKIRDKQIFNRKLDKEFFLENSIDIDDYVPESINTGVWVDKDEYTKQNSISLLTVFLNPESDNYIIYRIKIGDQGNYIIEKLEDY